MHEKIIVAVDFGTHKITAVAARKNERGALSVLSVETEDSEEAVLRGRIYNQEKTVYKLKSLLAKLKTKHSITIEKIYVAIGGQSVHSVPYTIVRKLEGEQIVDQKVLDNVLEECLNIEPENGWAVVGAASPEYKVDGRQERDPRGVKCSKLEVTCRLLVGRPSLERNLREVAKKAEVSIADIIPSTEAVAEAVLNSSEKEMGCALIDFGAGVTNLSIYKNRLLQFFVTLPLGSNAITSDLMSDNRTLEEAEAYKRQQGAVAHPGDTGVGSEIVEARVEEILKNVDVQLKRAGLDSVPPEGVVITGGGALLKGLPEIIRETLKCKVRVANTKDTLFIQEAVLNASPEYALVSGLLALGKDNCAQAIKKEEPVQEPQITDLFGQHNPPEPPKKPEPPKEPKKPKEPQPSKGETLFGRLKKKVDSVSKDLFDNQDAN